MVLLKAVLVGLALLASGWSDAQGFAFGHRAFQLEKQNLADIALALVSFLLGGIFFLVALWLKRDVLVLPTIVEFLCWLVVAYVGIMLADPELRHWPLIDHVAVLVTLGCVTFLAYRHGGV
jgi:hypothetical protein